MTWTDITSYSRGDTERKPRVFECALTPHISIKVHKHIHCGDVWLLTAPCVSLECFDLKTTDLDEAKDKACAIISQKLLERRSVLDEALSELSKPAARWVCDDDDQGSWRCSECGYEAMPADWYCTPYEEGMNFCPHCGAKMQNNIQPEKADSEYENDMFKWNRKKDGSCCLGGTCIHDGCEDCPVHQCYSNPATYDEGV